MQNVLYTLVKRSALIVALACAPSIGFSQDTNEALPDVEIGSAEFNDLPADVQVRLVRKPVIDALGRLRELVPSLFEDGKYTYSGDDAELQSIIGLMRELSSDLNIGGPLYQKVSAGIADAEALRAKVEGSELFSDSERVALLEEIAAQTQSWRDVRSDFDQLRNQMVDFTNSKAPAIQGAYEIRKQIKDNAEVLSSFEGLRDAAQRLLDYVERDEDTTAGETD